MSTLTKQLVNLSIVAIILTMAALGIRIERPWLIDPLSVAVLVPSFYFITALSLLIFNAGRSKSADTTSLFSLASMGIKFFLSAVLALIYFVALKKSGTSFVLLFLYYI
ncbi:MAG: hypothetical protein R2744_05200 [Bacteroidales bacterium]